MNSSASKPKMRGRPKGERLSPEDSDHIKKQIESTYGPSVNFYNEAFEEAKKAKSLGFRVPNNVDAVKRAFQYAFSGQRTLPQIYWRVLDELLGSMEDLPSKNKGAINQTKADADSLVPKLENMIVSDPALKGGHSEVLKSIPRQGKSLADWFRELSLPMIKRSLIAASVSGSGGGLQIEAHDLECLQVVAEKIVSSNGNDVADFYDGFTSFTALEIAQEGAMTLIRADDILRSEFLRMLSDWLVKHSDGEIFRNLHRFVSHCLYFFTEEYSPWLDESLGKALRSLVDEQLKLEKVDLYVVGQCVGLLSSANDDWKNGPRPQFQDYAYTETIAAVLYVFARNNLMFLKIVADQSEDCADYIHDLFREPIVKLGSLYRLNDDFIKDWNQIHDFFITNRYLPTGDKTASKLKKRRSG